MYKLKDCSGVIRKLNRCVQNCPQMSPSCGELILWYGVTGAISLAIS